MFQGRTGLLSALPALVVLFMLIAYPVAYTGLLSVTDNRGNLVGLDNFGRHPPRVTAQALVNTVYALGSIVFQVILGVAAAILLNQNFRGRAIVRSITLIPWVIPGIVAATCWAWMFHTEFGIINYMMTGPACCRADRLAHQPRHGDAGDDRHQCVEAFPFVAIMVLAGLQSIPNDLYEAARVDGANFWQEVWYVSLPGVRPVIVAVTLLLVIWGLNAITIIFAITRGGPANRTLITPIQIFRLAFESVQFNQAAALSVMFFAVTIVIVFLYIRVLASQPGEVK